MLLILYIMQSTNTQICKSYHINLYQQLYKYVNSVISIYIFMDAIGIIILLSIINRLKLIG